MGELRRVLRLPAVVAESAGFSFATSSFAALGQLAAYAGGSAWTAVLAAGLLAAGIAGCFSELNGMFPSAAAIRVYLHEAYGDPFALAASLTYVVVTVMVLGAEAYVLTHAVARVLPGAPAAAGALAVLALGALLNLRGIQVSGRFQAVATYAMLGSALAIALLAFGHPSVPPGPAGPSRLPQAVAVAVYLFVGFEWVTPLSEEVVDPRSVARGMGLAVALLCAVFVALALAMGRVLGPGAALSAAPQILFAQRVAGPVGAWWMLAVSVAASATTFNAGFAAASRLVFTAARDGFLPAGLGRLDPAAGVPRAAVWLVLGAAVAAAGTVAATRGFEAVIDLGAAAESLIYVLAAVAVLRLRGRDPDRPRPYRAWGGAWAPALAAGSFAVLGVLALAAGGWAPSFVPALGMVLGLRLSSRARQP